MSKQKEWWLSATWLDCFKACPYRCYLKNILRIIPTKKTDSLRVGTNWHRLLEIMGMISESPCPDCHPGNVNPDCPLCQETGILPKKMMDAAIREINQAYAIVPDYKEQEEWELERIILLYTLSAYNWYWGNQDYKVVWAEENFKIPLINPETDRALPNVKVVGKIDKLLITGMGVYLVGEHKSTSKSIDGDSNYWKRLRLNSQSNIYPLALKELLSPEDMATKFGGILYDVWHKPTIRPKKLTQGDSKKFIENGEYCGQKFKVVLVYAEGINPPITNIRVNRHSAIIEPGAKDGTFAIRETPEMFGARLLQDITERPEFYFARREIPILEADMEQFKHELYNIYQTARNMNKANSWYHNDQSCEATFHCPYIPICYNNLQVDEKNIPDGFIIKERKKENDKNKD